MSGDSHDHRQTLDTLNKPYGIYIKCTTSVTHVITEYTSSVQHL